MDPFQGYYTAYTRTTDITVSDFMISKLCHNILVSLLSYLWLTLGGQVHNGCETHSADSPTDLAVIFVPRESIVPLLSCPEYPLLCVWKDEAVHLRRMPQIYHITS